MEQSSKWGLSGGTLKIIALITMIIDHATYIFVDYSTHHNLYLLGRGIGRLAFPIYCFLIVEGFVHTRNVKKYCFRLFLFALLSEVPFDLAFYGSISYPEHQNVFFTLLLGLLLLCLVKWVRQGYETLSGKEAVLRNILATLALLAIYAASQRIQADYGFLGVLLILFFYIYHNRKIASSIANASVNFIMSMGSPVQIFGACSILPICLYNGKKGVSLKYFFYVIYPVHLLLFYFIYYHMI